MDNLNKLKDLEYINYAVNSISKIEGLKRCESLRKLDLTLNFIDVEDFKESMDNLEWCPDMSELYLMGNPCMDWINSKEYVYAKVPSINRLDGMEVTRAMKLAAKTKLPLMEKELEQLANDTIAKKEWEKKEGKFDPNKYSREQRW